MKQFFFLLLCFPLLAISQPQYEWAYGLGGPGDDYITDMVTDDEGNLYVTGYFEDYLSIDPFFIPAITKDTSGSFLFVDAFLAKVAPNGDILWLKTVGSWGYDWGAAVEIDSQGKVWWAGSFSDTITIDGLVLEAKDPSVYQYQWSNDGFVAKLNPDNGNALLAARIGGISSEHISSMRGNALGEICLTGTYYSDTLLWQGGEIKNITNSQYQVFVLNFDKNLQPNWGKSILVSTDLMHTGNAPQVIWNSKDESWVIGVNSVDSVSADEGQNWLTGLGSFYALSFDRSGNFVNNQAFPGLDIQNMACSELGFLVSGTFRGNGIFDSLVVSGSTSEDNLFLSCWDKMGKIKWVKTHPFSRRGESTSLAVAHDLIYLGGNTLGDLYLAPWDTLFSAGLADGFVLSYTIDGVFRWGKAVGGNSDNFLENIAIGKGGDIFTSGSFYSLYTLADTIVINNTVAGLERFEGWIGKMQDSLPTTSAITPIPASAIKVYPNPFEDHLSIQGLPVGQWEFRLTGLGGKEIRRTFSHVYASEIPIQLDFASLEKGMYILTLRKSGESPLSVLVSNR